MEKFKDRKEQREVTETMDKERSMTREGTVRNLLTELIDMIDNGNQRDLDRADEIGASIIKLFKQQPCDKAISKQAAIDEIRKCRFVVDAIEKIRGLPPITPQPKTGYWIVDGSVDCYLDKVRCHCSECGKKKEFPAEYDHIKQKLSISYQYSEFIDNFCPNCGAKMKGDTE